MTQTIICAFQGLHFNPSKIPNMAEVVAPPYDVIDDQLRVSLMQRHPCNIVHLILPEEEKAGQGRNKYEMAAAHLKAWQQEAFLVKDQAPALYLYHHTYSLGDGHTLTRKGFIAARRLESFETGRIRPHEYTFAGPKADRMQLIQATQTNLSPIFGVFSDSQREVMKNFDAALTQKPLFDLTTDEGHRHQLWAVTDPEIHDQVNLQMQNSTTFIADGHHRYETALAYRDYCRKQNSNQQEAATDYVMMYLCPMEDEGLVILPTHRVLDISVEVSEDILKKLPSVFKQKEFDFSQKELALTQLTSTSKTELSFLLSFPSRLVLISIDQIHLADLGALSNIPKEVRELDVTVLHRYLIPEIVGLQLKEGDEAKKIHYVKDTQEALKMPNDRKASLSFILNPTQMKQVEAVSNIGERMPHKSTFFYPKLLSGLVLNNLGD